MKLIFLVFIIFNVLDNDAQIISDEKYEKLPPLFLMYTQPKSCWAKTNFDYCLIDVQLFPENNLELSETWQTIELMNKHNEYFQRDKIKMTVCLDMLNNENNTADYLLEEYVNPHLNGKGISASVKNITCEHTVRGTIKFSIYDVISIVTFTLCFFLTYKATISDQSKLSKYLRPFSLKNNIVKVLNLWKESNRIKAIDSLRVLTMTLVVFVHSLLSFYSSFIQNTKYLEDMCFNKKMMFIAFTLVVTMFFLLSGWMLSYHSMQIFATSSNQISFWKFFTLQAINRYCRLIPLIIFSILLSFCSFLTSFASGPVIHIDTRNVMQDCNKNWWVTMLFIQNHYQKATEICLPITWYLAADFQLYMISLIILYVVWKWKLPKTIVFTLLMTIGLALHAFLIWQHDFPMFLTFCGRRARRENLHETTVASTILYMGTYTNFVTYMIGLVYGYCLFYQKEEQPIRNNIVKNALLVNFLISPVLIVYIMLQNDRVPKMFVPILGALHKPLMAFAVGGGIFAMIKGHGGWIKKIFEIKLFVFLANFAYSVYIFHPLVVFERSLSFQKPLEINGTVMISGFIKDWTLSIILGVLMFIIIELPFSQLKLLIIPKLSRDVKKNQ